VADGENPELPMSETISRKVELASGDIAEKLELTGTEEVIVLSRKRNINGELCILEDIYLPKKFFDGLMDEPEIPHTLYHFYQTNYGHTVQNISDRIKAIIVSDSDAESLNINKNVPLLMFTRLAKSLTGQSIEYRITRCRSDKYHYLANLA
jgi:GntR family transcriptional regulator